MSKRSGFVVFALLALFAVSGCAAGSDDSQQRAPVVVTFYRGGWRPYCTKALSAWATKLDELASAGGVLVAISSETAEHSIKTINKAVGEDHANLIALVDAQGEAMREFRAAFAVDERTQKRYRRFGIDLTEKNMSGRWELPAPVTYVIDAQGVVRWVYADWDYEKRADPDDVIAFVRTLHVAE